jgi:cobalt-zinc-cadmium resistance protein CzcA
MSFGGLAIAIGMIVDGAIVMVENVDRMLHEEPPETPRREIVVRACREVGRPVAFAIAIILIVFLPLFALEGVEGKTFRPLAYTVALAMAGSLVFALVVAPLLSDVLMRRSKRWFRKKSAPQIEREPIIIRILLMPYRPMLHLFVRFRAAALMLSLGLLVVGGWVFPQLGAEFTPALNEGTIVIRLTMAPSISLEESGRIATLVERRLMGVTEVTSMVTRVGRGEVGAHADPVNSAEMFVILTPPDQWRVPRDLERMEDVLRDAIGNPPGVLASFTQPIEMTIDELLEGVRAELAVKLFGPDLDLLKSSADEIAAVILEVPGAADVQVDQVSGTPQLLIRVDREAVARFGINVDDVQSVIEAAVGGHVAGQIFEGTKRFEILVRYPAERRSTAEQIANILIDSPTGIRVPLAQLAQIEEIVGPRQITRENAQRFITIQCNVSGRDIVSFVEDAQAEIDADVVLPPGYFITWGGQFRLQQEANQRLALVVPVTLLLIFILLYGSFGSLSNTLLILLNIPLALVGGVVALWLSGQNLSVPASVGFIALFGIALENAMVLLTYMNQLRDQGMSINEASVKGACLRLRPVLMTAITTALGLTPLLFATGTGSEVQRPLATVVVGGLVSSTALTLLVLPALYKWFAGRSDAPETI